MESIRKNRIPRRYYEERRHGECNGTDVGHKIWTEIWMCLGDVKGLVFIAILVIPNIHFHAHAQFIQIPAIMKLIA